eukprot:1906208-Rhodomonas_salina.2
MCIRDSPPPSSLLPPPSSLLLQHRAGSGGERQLPRPPPPLLYKVLPPSFPAPSSRSSLHPPSPQPLDACSRNLPLQLGEGCHTACRHPTPYALSPQCRPSGGDDDDRGAVLRRPTMARHAAGVSGVSRDGAATTGMMRD